MKILSGTGEDSEIPEADNAKAEVQPDDGGKEEKKPKKEEPKKEEPKKPEPKKEEPKKPDPVKEEPKKQEPKRQEPDRKKEIDKELEKELDSTQKQSDRQKTLQDQRARAEAEANLQGQLKAEQASAGRSKGLADYAQKLRLRIKDKTSLTGLNVQGNPQAVFEVTQLPSGEILTVKLRKSSGNKPLDEAIERGILKSSPLPSPDQADLFQRDLEIKYKPFDE